MDKTKLIIFGVIGAAVLIVIILGVGVFTNKQKKDPKRNIITELSVWVIDKQEFSNAYKSAIEDFKLIYPKVDVSIKKFKDESSYKNALFDGLASNSGPDVFVAPSDDIQRFMKIIRAASPTKISPLQLSRWFPDVIYKNLIYDNKYVIGVPVSISTLSLIYNKDLLGAAGIVFPPKTWDELLAIVPKLTQKDAFGNIIQSAVALGGTSRSVTAAKDILTLLLFQLNNDPKFYNQPNFSKKIGENAFKFYAQFGDKQNEYYTWNDSLGKDTDSFAQNQTAMIISYPDAVNRIKKINPFINLDIAPVPQLKDVKRTVNFARFWFFTVSAQSKYPEVAWDFILTLTTAEKNAESYFKETGQPPALLSLINKYINDPEYNTFLTQALTSRIWMEPNPEKDTKLFDLAISALINHQSAVRNVISNLSTSIKQLQTNPY